ncbi:MAG TPA: TonB-dependent receptor [Thermoanaerobaculia bacterium]|nr:TonB-dependent receptor [Thermoanaerobaculia bacterium]
MRTISFRNSLRAIRFLVLVCLALLIASSVLAASLSGVVRDSSGQPLAGAGVAVEGVRATTTSADGNFSIDLPPGQYSVRITRAGFQSEVRKVVAGADAISLEITLKPVMADSIVVSGIRAEAATPVTKTTMEREQIEKQYYGQDVPLLLRDTPSVNAYAEAGVGGSGYSYITLRGISPTRLNMTLDGVPLADSEDMGVYFADFPDLAHSLQSIQVQRGVGTSTVGSPSFGGSINLQSIDLARDKSVGAEVAAGSFGSKLATVGFQSGALPGGFLMYARLSVDQSDGFRESSGVRQHNFFVSAARQGEKSQWRLTGFSAHEYTQQSFLAVDAGTLKQNLRANPLSPQDRDSFGYDLAQVQYLRSISDQANLTASVFYQRGYGWYRLYDDEVNKYGLRQYGLDGLLVGSMVTLSYTRGPLIANYGLHVNEFRRDHTRDLVGGPRDYANYGTKAEANAFAKFTYDLGRTHLYSDSQVRYTDFQYHGDVAIDPIHWTFFNPKIGARYDATGHSGIYVSAGLSRREPTRNDLFQGEDNASVAHDLHAVKPERLLDIEAGWDYRNGPVTLNANLYAMEFHNEIAATGELSDIGLALRRNVDRSYRRGLEIEGTWQATPQVRLRGNASFSHNRIRDWTQAYDVYDSNGNIIDQKLITHHNVNPILTPQVILNEAVEYTPSSVLSLGAVGRYVGKSYLDNTNNADFTTPSFATLDLNAAVGLGRWITAGRPRLSIQVNNVLNNKRVFPSGYSYLFLTRDATGSETLGGIPYYYPQATRNVVVMLDVKL